MSEIDFKEHSLVGSESETVPRLYHFHFFPPRVPVLFLEPGRSVVGAPVTLWLETFGCPN